VENLNDDVPGPNVHLDRVAPVVAQRPSSPAVARMAEYFHDQDPPPVQGLVVAAFAAVRDGDGRVLLVRRKDDGNWELPGGRVEIGETVASAAVREVAEEAGIAITLTTLSGVYSDPHHIVVYPDEGPCQQIAVCFHALPTTARPELRPDHVETTAAAWFAPVETADLTMHPAVRQRLTDAVTRPGTPTFE